jgi:hypothetical protein
MLRKRNNFKNNHVIYSSNYQLVDKIIVKNNKPSVFLNGSLKPKNRKGKLLKNKIIVKIKLVVQKRKVA